uniref:Cytochrome P450 n=1 Tax=Panagrolaimus sp. JU765 TaxID=591449 RepID=A0AC34QE93_9BILA
MATGILVCITTIFYYYLNQHNQYWQRQGIPGPKGNIFFGNLLQVFKSQHDFDRINTEKFGGTFGTIMLGTPALITNDLDFIQEVVIKHFDAFPDRLDVASNTKDDIRGNFLTRKKGDDWRRIRHRITPAFTSAKMKRLINVMNLCSKELVENLETFSKTGKDVPLKDMLSKLTMNVIGRSVFAANFNSFDETQKTPFLYYSSKLLKVSFADPIFLLLMSFPNLCNLWTKLTGKLIFLPDVMDYYRTTLNDIMDQRLGDSDAPNKFNDVFQLLLNSLEETNHDVPTEDKDIISENVARASKDKKTVTRAEIIAQLVIFLVAGYETTASTLHFICYILSQQPEIQEKLRDEVLSVLDGKDSV